MEEEKGEGALILRTPRRRGASKGNRQRRGKNSTKASVAAPRQRWKRQWSTLTMARERWGIEEQTGFKIPATTWRQFEQWQSTSSQGQWYVQPAAWRGEQPGALCSMPLRPGPDFQARFPIRGLPGLGQVPFLGSQ